MLNSSLLQGTEEFDEKVDEKVSLRRGIVLCLVFALNIPTFGLFGLHYLYFAFIYEDKQRYLRHFALYCVGASLLSLGIWCRSSESGYKVCDDGAEMSRDCLWSEQRVVYQLNYTLHYMGGAVCICHSFFDLCSLPAWVRDVYNGNTKSPSLFWSPSLGDTAMADSYYLLSIAWTWMWFNSTWMLFFNWSTLDGLSGLAAVLFGQIFLWYAAISIYFHYFRNKVETQAQEEQEAVVIAKEP